MSGTVVDVTDTDFEAKVIKATGPVLAVFRAEWSAPCRALDPILA
ncbi:thioredoxin domain-containing protein [Streptomyces sp. BE308]|nr:thioredoxin domain-containing protein [Streptomyces sp. BE308]MEE1796422.1 thioredoxin domain-containing protein [Streptomyces sp. BE308]